MGQRNTKLSGFERKEKKVLLPVENGQQLRGGNEALNGYMKPNFKHLVKQKNRQPINFNFRVFPAGIPLPRPEFPGNIPESIVICSRFYYSTPMFDIRQVSIFNTLSAQDAKEIAPYLQTENFRKKESIFSEGDPSEWLYIVKKGKVKITKLSQEGKEIILELISPTDFFGGIAVVRGFPYPANAVAMEDTEVLKISRKNLLSIMDRFPNLMYCMATNIGDRIKGSHETLKSIALEKVEARIASLLIKLSDKAGEKTPEGIAINIKLTKQDIAEMVGTTVETSIRTMSRLSKMGLVISKGGKLVIRDLAGLRSLT